MKLPIQILCLLFLGSAGLASAQTEKEKKSIEEEVKKLDAEHAQAVLSGDLKTMDKYWTEDFIVNNPFNEIDRADRVRNGTVTYSSFKRDVEAVTIHGNTVITMGKETVIPKGSSPQAGKTIYRRYTNIWMKIEGRWRLVARHASVICGA